MQEGLRYPVLYILPVTAGTRGYLRLPADAPAAVRLGNGILEAKEQEIASRFGVVCVAPTFSIWPWIADHATECKRALETYLPRVVTPLIEANYPVIAAPAGRLLVGFSKSGVAAFSLLLRHPDVFGYAAAWDAPLTLPAPDKWNMLGSYGTEGSA